MPEKDAMDAEDGAYKAQDLTMKSMWQDASARFADRTGLSLDLKPPKTLDDCVGVIEKRQQPVMANSSFNTSSRTEKAKEFGIDIIRCLKLLGGVAAQGADMVFPPSSLCFNALSLLLDIPEKLQSFHQAIDGLFETLGPGLSMFRIYERIEQFNEIEPELKQAIHKLMISFVDICSLSIKLRDSGRWKKFKVAVSLVLLDKDSGVKDEIENFKSLTAAHTSIQATQTLKVVLETNSSLTTILGKASETGLRIEEIAVYVAHLKDADDKRKSDEMRRNHLQNIKDKVDLEDSIIKDSKTICDNLYRDCVTDTAAWFEDREKHPDFHKWAERDDAEANALFLLTGDSNTGKSFVMSSVVHRLRAIYKAPNRQSPRTLVASYFFPSSIEKNDTTKRPIETALKCIAMQFADADSAYAKRVSQSCDAKEDIKKFMRDASCQELWDFFGIGTPKGRVAHYLVIDGLASLPESYKESREQFFAVLETLGSAQSPVRVLLSVRPSTLEAMGQDLVYSKIDVEKHNDGDIRLYIDNELKNDDILQDDDEDSTRIRDKIRETLSTELGGNYYKVRSALEKIKAVVAADGLESEVDTILEESNKDEKAISQIALKKLEDTLRPDEINELNELLIWVIFGSVYFNIEQLNAALFLRFKTRSMLQLEKKLKGKYASIFEVYSNGFVSIIDGMEDLLKKERTEPRNVDDTPKFSATITITKADLSSVQSFLWSFMQKTAQDNFGFQELEENQNVKGTIQTNEFDAHLTIVRRTFDLLAEPPNPKTQALGSYLLNFLPQHLEALDKATELDALTPLEKREIGDGLFSLFISGEVIETHWDSCHDLIWYHTPDELDIFLGWLKEPSVVRHLGRLDREWLQEVASDSNPYHALLMKVMKTVAQHWVQDREWEVKQAFLWLRDYLGMEPPKERDPPETGDDGSDAGSAKGSQQKDPCTVDEVASWCQGILGVTEPDSVWDERLAQTHYELDEVAEAIEKFKKAIDRGNPSAICLEGLANALARDGKFLEACQEVDKAVQILESEDPKDEARLGKNYIQLAKWYSELQQPKRAIEYMRKALALAPEDDVVLSELLLALLQNDDEPAAIELLLDLSARQTTPGKTSWFSQVIEVLMSRNPSATVGKFLSVASRNSELFTHLLSAIDDIIRKAEKENNLYFLTVTQLYKGIAIYHYNAEAEAASSRAAALDCWRKCFDFDTGYNAWHLHLASTLLSSHYFEQARTSQDPSNQQEHLEKLKSLVKAERQHDLTTSKSYLVSYYSISGNDSDSRALAQAIVESAFEMLSDDADENDWEGYYNLASILMRRGDLLNALSGFSLLLPLPGGTTVMSWVLDFETDPEQSLNRELLVALGNNASLTTLDEQFGFISKELEKRLSDSTDIGEEETKLKAACEGIQSKLAQFSKIKAFSTFGFQCDGPCNRKWDFEMPINLCKYCLDKGFCNECLQLLKEDKLRPQPGEGTVCNKTHDWLYLPKWDRESYLGPLLGNVRVGGHLEDGRRVGGDVVPISTWLDGLRDGWGLAKQATALEVNGGDGNGDIS